MRVIALIFSLIFLTSCAATYTEVGQKKTSFHPVFDSDCKRDDKIVSGMLGGVGFICAHDNGIIFVRQTLTKFTMSDLAMQKRAQKYCDLYHENKKAVNKGKANINMLSRLDYKGIEYTCI
ncbi:hypothetical protein N9R73_00520 [Candidatus Pelagibacter sp.]|nr:hypothetical protein [Candidatus Pelagibacter sp.]